jgi:hypothetical protein
MIEITEGMSVNTLIIELVNNFYIYLLLVIEGVYILFAFIVTRQIKLMNRSFHTPLASIFTLLGRLHLLAAVIVLILTILLK